AMDHLDTVRKDEPCAGLGFGVVGRDHFDRAGLVEAERPLRDIEMMRADVCHSAAGILAITAPRGKMVVHAARAEHGTVRPRRRVTEPQVPIEAGLHGFLLEIAPPAGPAHADADSFNFADATIADEFARERELPEHPRPLLAAGLQDTLVF